MEVAFCNKAAESGETELLEWLRSEGCPWSAATSAAAFEARQLDTLFWLRFRLESLDTLNNSRNHSCVHSKWEVLTFRIMLQTLQESLQQASANSASLLHQTLFNSLSIEILEACSYFEEAKRMTEAAEIVISGGGTSALQRLLQNDAACILQDAQYCTMAAQKGQLEMLQFMRSHHPPCPWDEECGLQALKLGQRHVLEWLHAQDYPWTLACTVQAAKNGDLDLLTWMRSQVYPWPWDSSVCNAAVHTPGTLQWLLNQSPPCPWAAEDTVEAPGVLARLGDASVIQRLCLPIHSLPQLGVKAAKYGRLYLLKWLVQQQCPLTSQVLTKAMDKEEIGIIHFLLAEHSPPMPADMERVSTASPATFLALAQAGCPMRREDASRIKLLVEPWYLFMGLRRWAVHQTCLAMEPQSLGIIESFTSLHLLEPGVLKEYLSSGETASLPRKQNAQQLQHANSWADGMLKQLVRLPPELVEKIASAAFLCPQQAEAVLSGPSDDACLQYIDN